MPKTAEPKDIISTILIDYGVPIEKAQEATETIIAGLEHNIDLEAIKREFVEKFGEKMRIEYFGTSKELLKGKPMIIKEVDLNKKIWHWIEEKIKQVICKCYQKKI